MIILPLCTSVEILGYHSSNLSIVLLFLLNLSYALGEKYFKYSC